MLVLSNCFSQAGRYFKSELFLVVQHLRPILSFEVNVKNHIIIVFVSTSQDKSRKLQFHDREKIFRMPQIKRYYVACDDPHQAILPQRCGRTAEIN